LHRLLLILIPVLLFFGCSKSENTAQKIRIGCKNFSEQLILGEMMAQLLENEDISVDRKFGLGSTALIHTALVKGEIDVYAEYTGTAAQAILNLEGKSDLKTIRERYQQQFQLEWLEPFGFNNTYAIAVRKRDAQNRKWARISDLKREVSTLRAGFNAEFMERSDGYPGLQSRYQLKFGKIVNLDAGLIYQALQQNKVDVISAFSTDGRLNEFGLLVLEDDLQFFPRYDPVPVVRNSILMSHPQIREILRKIPGHLDEAAMRALNFEVDGKGKNPADVARAFLLQKKLLQSP
jgi:glycine betaine/choline ABC-type transport system substrate-binding protein